MNIQQRRNEVRRLLDPMKKINKFGSNGFNTGSTKKHELKKFEIAWEHKRLGHEVILEPQYEHGRGDVLCTDEAIDFEVVVSEKEVSLIRKSEVYPDVLTIEVVYVE